ncbi:MAG TPA: hypothetical protein EYG51_25245 [Pseudomonadales bacterium]|nr:hypothetical protein [Pseudomonadales bacterium]
MSTRFSRTERLPNSIDTGYEIGFDGIDVPEDFEAPPCSIEDVDRALFDLFNEQLPMYYTIKREQTRIPVIFATGERFAILSRKKPLRDKAGALILPMISIIRTGVNQDDAGLANNQTEPMVVRQRLSQKDPQYQTLLNKLGLENQDDSPSRKHFAGRGPGGVLTGSLPGTVASRRDPIPPNYNAQTGRLLAPSLSRNIFEIITLPPSKFFKSEYEVTFWTQYTQQMNKMMAATMVSSQWYPSRSFRIESPKGYWFVATIDSEFTSQSNYDDFSDDERVIRMSFKVSVPGYLVAPEFPGSPPALRRTLSAPELSFDVSEVYGDPVNISLGGVASGDPGSYILSDLTNEGDGSPAGVVAGSPLAQSLADVDPSMPGGSELVPGVHGSDGIFVNATSTIGGYQGGVQPVQILRMIRDPFTGAEVETIVRITTSNRRKGETVYQQARVTDLGDL